MRKFHNICVYCASSSRVDEGYITMADAVGQLIASSGAALVYGGANVGLMGACADAVLEKNGKVVGVMPRCLMEREVAHEGLTTLHITETMQERQKMMADLSDAFVVLPGGIGTLAEFFEIITWRYLELHSKPIFILNHNEYWNHLIAMLEKSQQDGFLYRDLSDLVTVCDGFEDFRQYLS
ncbi:MAG: TIGR00730 family Rossman fold protein [Bdellovibrionales bacterium]